MKTIGRVGDAVENINECNIHRRDRLEALEYTCYIDTIELYYIFTKFM